MQAAIKSLPAEWSALFTNTGIAAAMEMWPASLAEHHTYPGGLAVRTAEVLHFAMGIQSRRPEVINPIAVTVAAIMHDYGKLWDYRRVGDEWVKTPHYGQIRHVARSYAEFLSFADFAQMAGDPLVDRIGHCILSHHGRLDQGSPVVPATPEAWAVHLADMASAFCMGDRPNHGPV